MILLKESVLSLLTLLILSPSQMFGRSEKHSCTLHINSFTNKFGQFRDIVLKTRRYFYNCQKKLDATFSNVQMLVDGFFLERKRKKGGVMINICEDVSSNFWNRSANFHKMMNISLRT